MRTLMKEEEKRQREHDAAIEVLRRYLDKQLAGIHGIEM